MLISLVFINVVCCSEELSRIYIAEIICAVSFLHRNGIVHGDLKSGNILLDSEGHVSGCLLTIKYKAFAYSAPLLIRKS